jgi:predicted nuclease of predicted toxin-antitoxin system
VRENGWEALALTLKLLLDEHYAGLKPYLQALGVDATTAQEAGLQGKDDVEVGRYAAASGMILVTQDELPAAISEMLGGRSVQVRQKDVAALVKALAEKLPP